MKPRVLILHADGTNRDYEAAQAFELAGAESEIVHLNQLRAHEKRWADYQLLAIPGGFSYADALGAGKLLALDLNAYFADEVGQFIDSGRPVIGICNGFQALVKSGLLPNQQSKIRNQKFTLTFNALGHFECRWVTLKPQSQTCVWTRGLADLIECPIAHGEGNFVLSDPNDLQRLRECDQVALTYTSEDGLPANGEYPINPNGSTRRHRGRVQSTRQRAGPDAASGGSRVCLSASALVAGGTRTIWSERCSKTACSYAAQM